MYWFKSLLVLLLLTTCFTGRTSAIECYSCESDHSGDCSDPLDEEKKSKVKTCNEFRMGLVSMGEAHSCVKTEDGGKGNQIVCCKFLDAGYNIPGLENSFEKY